MRFILKTVVFVFLISLPLNAQEFSFTGIVKDADSNEPVAGAQIFLNGSTIGTTSDGDGNFKLTGIPSGIYEVVASFIGYNSASATFNTSDPVISFDFILTPRIYQLDEIVVKPDPEIWKQNFMVFSENMIGEGPFSESVSIKNPEVLVFDFNPDTGILIAEAHDRLEIENKDLGYILFYYLEIFELNFREKTSVTLGRPLFKPMSSRWKRTNNKWKNNRQKAYLGSFQHFTNTYLNNTADTSDFEVKREVRKDGQRFLYPEKLNPEQFFSTQDSSTFLLTYPDLLNVTYTAEYEDESYLKYISSPFDTDARQLVQHQNSILIFRQDSIRIDHSGYIYNPLGILFDGYWGFERISDMLPLDYSPEKK
jgi:hypothetical protein